jgi:integrase
VSATTQARYEDATRNFEQFVGRELRTLSPALFDSLMVQYMEQLFVAGETAAVARYALYGVAWVFDLVTRDLQVFALAKKTLQGFAKKAPEPSRDPPLLELTWLAADFFERTSSSDEGLMAALATLLAVDGYLRPSETVGLRSQDFFKSGRGCSLKWSVVVAPLTRGVPAKNKQFDDGFVVGAYDRHHIKDFICALTRRALPKTRVFMPLTLPRWEQLCRDFCRSEGVQLTPPGLRHTGPRCGVARHPTARPLARGAVVPALHQARQVAPRHGQAHRRAGAASSKGGGRSSAPAAEPVADPSS